MAYPSIDSFAQFFMGLGYSRVFFAAAIAWLSAEAIKWVLLYFQNNGKLSIKEFMNSGGMPSSHSSAMLGVTTAIFYEQGVSALFVLASVLSLVVMYDAQGVRYQSQKHAAILKKLAPKESKDLKMRIGHTKIQILAGAALGFIVATIVYLV